MARDFGNRNRGDLWIMVIATAGDPGRAVIDFSARDEVCFLLV